MRVVVGGKGWHRSGGGRVGAEVEEEEGMEKEGQMPKCRERKKWTRNC